MPRISKEQHEQLRQAILDHAFLHRILRHIEYLHRVVFHADDLDWQFIRASAEEILIADIVTRYQGDIDGVYLALRKIEDSGRSWQAAISEYAAYTHNYYTMPLGVILRKDLFGDTSHFVTPAAGTKAGPRQDRV
ncbi:MAG: hypothetical protein JXQ75_17000 [Phycisphaerae bacterium]|nr:hypothetical protein [Phycisphaerae bacterium]